MVIDTSACISKICIIPRACHTLQTIICWWNGRYQNFTNSEVQVVHIVGPPGFGKSTLSIKIEHYNLRKGVKSYYTNLKDVCDGDTFVEKMLVNVIGSADKKLTLNRLKRWVHNQYSQTLIVLQL